MLLINISCLLNLQVLTYLVLNVVSICLSVGQCILLSIATSVEWSWEYCHDCLNDVVSNILILGVQPFTHTRRFLALVEKEHSNKIQLILVLNACNIFASVQSWTFKASLNLTWLWPWMTSSDLVLNVCFILPSCPFIFTKFERDRSKKGSKMKFDLSLTLYDLDQSRTYCLFHTPVTSKFLDTQVWAQSEEVEIWPELDLGWPWPISFLMFVSYSHHIQVYFHQVRAQSEQVEILHNLDLGWPWPNWFLMFVSNSHHVQLYDHQVSAQSEHVEIWPDIWPWGPVHKALKPTNKHNHNLPWTKLHPPTKFQKCRTYYLWENWGTAKHNYQAYTYACCFKCFDSWHTLQVYA